MNTEERFERSTAMDCALDGGYQIRARDTLCTIDSGNSFGDFAI